MVACSVLFLCFWSWYGKARLRERRSPGCPPPGLQSHPAAAADDSLLYAVWTDGRWGTGRLFWTRFQEPVPDTLAAPVTGGGPSELRPAVAAGAGWALAVWEAWLETGTKLGAAELSGAGGPASGPWTEVTTNPGPVWRPAVAVQGEVALLVWEDEREAPGDLYFARWDRGMGLRDPGGLPLARGIEDQRWPRTAAGPNGFLVVWAESEGSAGYRVLSQTVDAGGEPAGPVQFLSERQSSAPIPDLAANSEGYLVVWRQDGAGGGDLVGRFVDESGSPRGVGALSLVAGPDLEFSPRLAAADSGYAMIWLAQGALGRSLMRTRVSAAGEADPPTGFLLGPPEDFCADAALSRWGNEAAALWRVPLPADDDDLLLARFAAGAGGGIAVVPLTLLPATVGVHEGGPPLRLRAEPNPFREQVCLRAADLPEGAVVDIFDVRGRRIRRLIASDRETVVWDGRSDGGSEVVPGVYFARIAAGRTALRLVRISR